MLYELTAKFVIVFVSTRAILSVAPAAFAYTDDEGNISFFAEQVSHHPPISVSQCNGKGWTAGETVDIVATYLGNSVEICNIGPQADRHVTLTETGDRYSWNLPKAVVSNLFIGGTFIDHYGTIELVNHTTKTKSILNLTKCGWFSAGRYEVQGELLSEDQEVVGTYRGQWNKFLDFERTSKARGEGSMRLWAAGKHLLPEEDGGGPHGTLPKFTKFGAASLRVNDDMKTKLLSSDSRLRPDRLALEHANSILASDEKLRIEQAQRERMKAMKSEGISHEPRWFQRVADEERCRWELKANYWELLESGKQHEGEVDLW